MSNEATIRASLQIKVGNLSYPSSLPSSFKGNVNTARGPTPGLVTAVLAVVTAVDLSKLTNPAYCRIMNVGDSAGLNTYVDVGLYDTINGKFRPLLEMLPGESYIVRLSRNLGEDENVPAPTGTSVGTNEQLALLAYGATSPCLVEAFEGD